MLVEMMKKYRDKSKYDLSCSETMVYAANEAYDLHLDPNTFKALAPFSGGMWIEDVCGALTGSLAVLGIIFTNHVAHESEHLKALTLEFIEKFEAKLGSRNCAKLKENYRTEEEGCNSVIYAAGEVLDTIVVRELKTKK
ncbi:C-GCAxxG-C-C family (seleno)protein [Marinisporobacter balticus]|uniref:C_GCAxxG_C_C family probable redox protein n=1 Tax=Marinisporobacter balticus TaxID=2018667 RepID=A0A4R2KL43_9FIRM|nr:C-GCAxxG-C-C family (seleno)protein [Marinisporobacter balticus]TCO74751.1 C_GCAxxG_C_C family probable redox protein [Marinisporobacter balticus]